MRIIYSKKSANSYLLLLNSILILCNYYISLLYMYMSNFLPPLSLTILYSFLFAFGKPNYFLGHSLFVYVFVFLYISFLFLLFYIIDFFSFSIACDSSCNTGLKKCVGSQTNCCPYFFPTDQCTTQCPTNFYASASNGFICSMYMPHMPVMHTLIELHHTLIELHHTLIELHHTLIELHHTLIELHACSSVHN